MAGKKEPLNVRIDPTLIYRVKRHALDRGTTASDIVAGLIREHIPGPDVEDEATHHRAPRGPWESVA